MFPPIIRESLLSRSVARRFFQPGCVCRCAVSEEVVCELHKVPNELEAVSTKVVCEGRRIAGDSILTRVEGNCIPLCRENLLGAQILPLGRDELLETRRQSFCHCDYESHMLLWYGCCQTGSLG